MSVGMDSGLLGLHIKGTLWELANSGRVKTGGYRLLYYGLVSPAKLLHDLRLAYLSFRGSFSSSDILIFPCLEQH